MNSTEFTRAEIETGRKLFAGDWRFVGAAASPASLPPMKDVEIAFAGRSNVGKSSLINALTGRKNLARISRTPGRTQELIFFRGDDGLNVVDMPGYGYAAAAKSKITAWTALIDAFLRGRSNLARVYVLVDARHGLKATDDPALDALGQAAVSHQIVLTKCDELKPADLAGRIADVETALTRRRAAFPTVLATSSHDGAGVPELRAAIARLLAERKS
ncbi:MAG: ribosome biogenesis GTP-binding protein YihA/YsxC [Pseudolabrys sp.]